MAESFLVQHCPLAVALVWVDGALVFYSEGDLVPILPVFAAQSLW